MVISEPVIDELKPPELFLVHSTHAPEFLKARMQLEGLERYKWKYPDYEYVGISQEWESKNNDQPHLFHIEYHFKLK